MHWWLLRANSEKEAEYDNIVNNLQQQLEAGKQELWEAHKEVTSILNQEENGGALSENENHNMDEEAATAKDAKPAAAAAESSARTTTRTTKQNDTKPNTIHVEIVQGPYAGSVYNLNCKKGHAWVGRSQGKKFRDKGISLPKDSEVSTSHGRFEFQRGNFYYMDAASTNGSLMGNEYLEPNVPYLLENGVVITAGQTVMQVSLINSKEGGLSQ